MLDLMTKQLKINQTSTSRTEEDFILRSLTTKRISIDPIYHSESTNSKSKRDVKKMAVKAMNSMLMKTESKRRSASCSELQGISLNLQQVSYQQYQWTSTLINQNFVLSMYKVLKQHLLLKNCMCYKLYSFLLIDLSTEIILKI